VFLASAGCAEEPGTLKIDASEGANTILNALVAEYRARHPRDNIILWAGLSGGDATQGVTTGFVDVAAVTMELSETEARRHGLALHAIARTGMLFGVHPGVTVTGLTRRQLCDVYSGALGNWRQLGGPDLPIKAGLPMPGESDGGNPIALVNCPPGFRFGANVQMIDPPDAMAQAISTTPGGIGMTSLSVLAKHGERFKAIAVDGVAPTADNISSGKYWFARTTSLVVRAKPPKVFSRFLRFIRSRDGESVIRAHGAVPID
jgi:phosphate transport system substrate-binding protein